MVILFFSHHLEWFFVGVFFYEKTFLQPMQMTLLWVPVKRPCFVGLTVKNRGHLGSRLFFLMIVEIRLGSF